MLGSTTLLNGDERTGPFRRP